MKGGSPWGFRSRMASKNDLSARSRAVDQPNDASLARWMTTLRGCEEDRPLVLTDEVNRQAVFAVGVHPIEANILERAARHLFFSCAF